MKLKKNLVVSIAAVSLLSAGTGIISQENSSQIVEAKTISKKLIHTAAVYNARGKRTHDKTLKKGKKFRIYGTKKIKGKKYYQIGKNKYVKIANFTKPKKKIAHKKHVTGLQATINKNSFSNPIIGWLYDVDGDDRHEFNVKESEKSVEVKAIRDTTNSEGKTYKAGTTFWIPGVSAQKGSILSMIDGPDDVYPTFYKPQDLKFTGYKPNKDPKIKKMNAEIKALQKDGDAINIFPDDLNEPVYLYSDFNLKGKATPFKDCDTNYNECQKIPNDHIAPVRVNGEYYYCFKLDNNSFQNYIIKASNVQLESDTMNDDD